MARIAYQATHISLDSLISRGRMALLVLLALGWWHVVVAMVIATMAAAMAMAMAMETLAVVAVAPPQMQQH